MLISFGIMISSSAAVPRPENALAEPLNKVFSNESDAQPRIVLVDTNSFLRLYQAEFRPIMGADVGRYRIKTLVHLVNEFRRGRRLQYEYGWANREINEAESIGAVLALEPSEDVAMLNERDLIKGFGNSLLATYCLSRDKPIPLRSLSTADATLIASAVVLHAVIVTDEWPMEYVARDLIDNGDEQIDVWNTIDLLALFEREGKVSANERRQVVKSWLREGEKLPRGWESQYQRLFSDLVPTVQ